MIAFNDHVPIIVCGGRDGQPWDAVDGAMDTLLQIVEFNAVVVGSRRGTDGAAFDWAMRRELIGTVVPAQWLTGTPRGKAAGPVRNARMPRLFRSAVAVAAFPGGSGTADMVEVAKVEQLPLWRWLGRRDGWRLA